MRRKNCFISALLTVVLACGSFTLSSCSGNSEQGIQGETGRGIAHIEIIDGYLWITYTDDLENPVNVGQIEEAVNGSEGLAYILSETNDYYKVRGWGLCSDYNIVIPATY